MINKRYDLAAVFRQYLQEDVCNINLSQISSKFIHSKISDIVNYKWWNDFETSFIKVQNLTDTAIEITLKKWMEDDKYFLSYIEESIRKNQQRLSKLGKRDVPCYMIYQFDDSNLTREILVGE